MDVLSIKNSLNDDCLNDACPIPDHSQTFLKHYSSWQTPCIPEGLDSMGGWAHSILELNFHRARPRLGAMQATGPVGAQLGSHCGPEGLEGPDGQIFVPQHLLPLR